MFKSAGVSDLAALGC